MYLIYKNGDTDVAIPVGTAALSQEVTVAGSSASPAGDDDTCYPGTDAPCATLAQALKYTGNTEDEGV